MDQWGYVSAMLSSPYVSRVVTFVGCLVVPALASAQEPLQFNVPYSCQDGYTRIISRCEKNARGGEVCFWREGKNGQFDSERYTVRAQMDWSTTCKAPPAQPPAAPRPAAQSPAAPQATAPPMPVARPGQPLNPAYLGGMPSPDAVKQRIQGSNAVDTLARQVAVLNRLPRLITDRMRLAPERKFDLTPDEIQVANAYSLTSYQLSQEYTKSATPEAVKSFQQLVARYEGDPALNDQMMGLLSAATLAEYRRVDRVASERAQARIDQQKRENEQAQALPATPGAAGARPMYNDPGTMQMRRCLELGGGTAECLGSGLKTGFLDLVGGAPAELLRLADGAGRAPGVRIGGTFAAAGGVKLEFSEGTVSMSSCGKLESASQSYTVTKRGSQLQVEIANEPKPLVIMLGPNNVFTGPAAFPITGQVITGYESRYVEDRRVSDNSVVVGSGRFVRVPIYETRTVNCGFASLRATAPAYPEFSVIGGLAGALDGQSNPAAQFSGTTEAPAGPRMGGTYAGGDLKVEFRSTAAVLDCGNAHVMRPYGVQNLADRVVITVRNGNVPLTLTLGADGALAGSGSVDVAGRLVTGLNGSDVTFAPHQERCTLGTLTLRNQ
jgi:hypothetical protein